MAGVKNGNAAKIKLMNAAALYETAVNDCIKNTKVVNDVWVLLKEICYLVNGVSI